MKTKIIKFTLILILVYCNLNASDVQLIHNSPDKAIASVDVWVNNVRVFSELEFRNATPWTELGSSEIKIAITNIGAKDTNGAIFNNSYSLDAEKDYIVVLSGLVSKTGYSPLKEFKLEIYDKAKKKANTEFNTDFLFVHNATDLENFDIVETGYKLGKIVTNIAYGNFKGYITMQGAVDLVFELRKTGQTTTFAKFGLPLSFNQIVGEAVTIFVSGFDDPSNNSNGAEYGLFMADTTGKVIKLDRDKDLTTKIQFINNSIDTNFSVVDFWVNNVRKQRGIKYKKGTSYFDVLSNQQITIAITKFNALDTIGALGQFVNTFDTKSKYSLILNGMKTDIGYSVYKPLELFVNSRKYTDFTNTDVTFFNGVTDAEKLDLVLRNDDNTYFTNQNKIEYGSFTGYDSLILDLLYLNAKVDGNANYYSNHSAYTNYLSAKGVNSIIISTGFIDSTANKGAPMSFYAVLNSGIVVDFEIIANSDKAKVQLINNCVDTNLKEIDIWINNIKKYPNIKYKGASPLVEYQAGVPYSIVVTKSNSVDTNNSFKSYNFIFKSKSKSIMILNGLLSRTSKNDEYSLKLLNFNSLPNNYQYETQEMVCFNGVMDARIISSDFVSLDGLSTQDLDFPIDVANISKNKYYYNNNKDYNFKLGLSSSYYRTLEFAANLLSDSIKKSNIVFVATGYSNPNNYKPDIETYFVFSDGTVKLLPKLTDTVFTIVQFINNSSDTAAEVLDIWKNNAPLVRSLHYKNATGYLSLATNIEYNLSVLNNGVNDTNYALCKSKITFSKDSIYNIIINGIISKKGYDPAPPLTINTLGSTRLKSLNSKTFELAFFNGVTDLPKCDLFEVTNGLLQNDLGYGEFTNYFDFTISNLSFQLRDETGMNRIKQFAEPFLKNFKNPGFARLLVFSGFAKPFNNSNGNKLSLLMLDEYGTLSELTEEPLSIDYSDISSKNNIVFPNPSSGKTKLKLDLQFNIASINLNIYDSFGKNVSQFEYTNLVNGTNYLDLDLSNLATGIYRYTAQLPENNIIGTISIVK